MANCIGVSDAGVLVECERTGVCPEKRCGHWGPHEPNSRCGLCNSHLVSEATHPVPVDTVAGVPLKSDDADWGIDIPEDMR